MLDKLSARVVEKLGARSGAVRNLLTKLKATAEPIFHHTSPEGALGIAQNIGGCMLDKIARRVHCKIAGFLDNIGKAVTDGVRIAAGGNEIGDAMVAQMKSRAPYPLADFLGGLGGTVRNVIEDYSQGGRYATPEFKAKGLLSKLRRVGTDLVSDTITETLPSVALHNKVTTPLTSMLGPAIGAPLSGLANYMYARKGGPLKMLLGIKRGAPILS